MARAADLPGSAHLEMVDGVVHLDPKPALLEAMLGGWLRQQQASFLKDATIEPPQTPRPRHRRPVHPQRRPGLSFFQHPA